MFGLMRTCAVFEQKGLERARKDGTPPRETRAFDYKEFRRLVLCDFIRAFFELCEEKLTVFSLQTYR